MKIRTKILNNQLDPYLDLLSVTETLLDILPPNTLYSKVGKLCSHVLIVDIDCAHSLLTSLPSNLQQVSYLYSYSKYSVSKYRKFNISIHNVSILTLAGLTRL